MPIALPPSALGDRFERAVTFAISSLRNDKRVTSQVAIARLFGICASVLENGGTEDEAIAGLIHASIDRRAAPQQITYIRETFGLDAAAIVEGCSERVSATGAVAPLPFYDRICELVERLRGYANENQPSSIARSVFFVSAVGTLYDARVTSEQFARDPDAFATREGKKFGTLWSLHVLADTYLAYDDGSADASDAKHRRFARELVDFVTAMAGKPVTTDELLAAFAIDATVEARDKGTLLAPPAKR